MYIGLLKIMKLKYYDGDIKNEREVHCLIKIYLSLIINTLAYFFIYKLMNKMMFFLIQKVHYMHISSLLNKIQISSSLNPRHEYLY